MNKPGNTPILQDLPPRWARFCLDIQDFMESLVQADLKGRKILAAFSGGADSTALLRVLDFIKPRAGISLLAVHLNHMLRTEADSEQEQAARICSELDIPFKCARIKIAVFARSGGMGIEEAARTVRYRFLQDAARDWQADYIVTGHHLNDLAEDVLMRLGRGTAWPGLSGMSGFDAARRLVRPFLLTSRRTILDFLNMLNQDHVHDASNESRDFLRNRIRHDIVPVMEEVSHGFLRSIANLWRLGRIDQEYWEEVMEDVLKAETGQGQLSYDILTGLPRSARLRIYKKMLDTLGPGQALFENLLELDVLWQRGLGGKTVMFPGNKLARIVNKGIMFGLKEKTKQ